MKWRTKKKRIKENAYCYAYKCQAAFHSKAEMDAWVREIVRKHPALMEKGERNA